MTTTVNEPTATRDRPRSTSSGAAGSDVTISAEHLTKRFGDTEVIHPMDLDVRRGTIIGLIGPSGSGKTTAVRLLTGLLEPTTGTAHVWGTPSSQLTSAQRARLGYLAQVPALFPDLSLTENLSFHASMYGLPLRHRRRRLDELLDWVELTEHRSKRVVESSGGMQRRLALAAAFVHAPDVVFLDEPTAGIDPILRDKFWQYFRAEADVGTTIVVTTQYVGEAGQCDIVGLLSDGELVLLDTPRNLRRAAFDGDVFDVTLARPVDESTVAQLADAPGVVCVVDTADDHLLRVVVHDAERATGELGGIVDSLGIDREQIEQHVVDFDEAFVRVVKRHRELSAGSAPEDDERRADGADSYVGSRQVGGPPSLGLSQAQVDR